MSATIDAWAVSLTRDAMEFAFKAHAGQVRKYTGNPYTDHLAEVVGYVATAGLGATAIAIAWLHDCIEDCRVGYYDLEARFGEPVARGVELLTDQEEGNRKQRKALARVRLANCPAHVQSIKVADLISNTASIVEHDPKFAKTYLEEKRMLLDELQLADPWLVKIAREQVG